MPVSYYAGGGWRTDADQPGSGGFRFMAETSSVAGSEGGTVQLNQSNIDKQTWATGGPYAALTFAFPANANTVIGEEIVLGSSGAIAAVTYTGATVRNGPVAFGANELYTFRKVTATEWARSL